MLSVETVLRRCSAIHQMRCLIYKLIVLSLLSYSCLEYVYDFGTYKHRIHEFLKPSIAWIVNLGYEMTDTNVTLELFQNGLNISSSNNNATNITKDCPLIPPNLVGKVKILTNPLPIKKLEKLLYNLMPGGRYKPSDCISKNKVAIVIPFRDRQKHLKIFLLNMHPILQRQQLDYGVYVVEQTFGVPFNRATLMNIGYVEALKQYSYDCFVFHDVDLIPEDDRNLYHCPVQPRHMSVAVDTMGYRLLYEDLFGGISALTKTHMETVNGFSNEFWGWGGEDDDMSNRIRYHGLNITRYSPKIARYTMLKHYKDRPNPNRIKVLFEGKRRYKSDGLSNLNYTRLDLVFKKLFTWILVKIKPIN